MTCNVHFTHVRKRKRVNLEESCVLRLFVVLLGCVFPRDPEHGFVLILPAQSFIFPTLYLSYQPLFHVHLSLHLQHWLLSLSLRSKTSKMSQMHVRLRLEHFNHVLTCGSKNKYFILMLLKPQILQKYMILTPDNITKLILKKVIGTDLKVKCRSRN